MSQNKLYVITRDDLSLAQQAVQSAHAAVDFVINYPKESREWHDTSNYLIVLSVSNEEELEKLYNRAIKHGLCALAFREPDINNQITSVAIEPSKEAKRICKKLSLALKSGTVGLSSETEG